LRDGISSDEKVKMRIKERNYFECIKETKIYIHRTQDHDNPHKHKSIVCVICDRFIIGTEKNHHLSKDNIGAHSQRLSVKSYKRYYETVLVPEVRKQYMINDGNLKDVVLSPRVRKIHNGYSTCSCCFSGMQPNMTRKRFPPKFVIANGFVIGSMPKILQLTTTNGEKNTRAIAEHELSDLLKAMMAPVGPYGSIF
jgi:hypothetical protein